MAEKNQLDDKFDRCEFRISRVINAPRQQVFQAWTDPAYLVRWWGPSGFVNLVCEMDVRPGGQNRIVMRSPNGVDYPIKGQFIEVLEPERLVMTLDLSEHPPEWHDLVEPNRAPGDDNPAGQLLQTVTFEDQQDKTQLTVRTRFESASLRDAMLKIGMNEGWSQSLDRLETEIIANANLTSNLPTDKMAPIVNGRSMFVKVSRRFSASAEDVFDAWLDPVTVGQWLFATPGGEMIRVEIDARVGGEFTIVERREDMLAEHFGRYVSIIRPHQLSFAFTTDKSEYPSFVSIKIEATTDGCELTLTHEMEAKWLNYADRVHSGWSRILEGLSNAITIR